MPDHTEREREAWGMVLARMECDWECDAATFVQGPCNCNRASFVDALISAVRAARDAEVREMVERMDGVMQDGDAVSRYEILTALEATDGNS